MYHPFRLSLPKEVTTEQPCVIKIVPGLTSKKFFIWKVKNLTQQARQIGTDIDRKIRVGTTDKDYFHGLVKHIIAYKAWLCRIEVLFIANNPVELIDYEAKILAKNQTNPDCLNNIFEQLVPKWVSEALNKPITDTISPSPVPIHIITPKSNPVVAKTRQKAPLKSKPISQENQVDNLEDIFDAIETINKK